MVDHPHHLILSVRNICHHTLSVMQNILKTCWGQFMSAPNIFIRIVWSQLVLSFEFWVLEIQYTYFINMVDHLVGNYYWHCQSGIFVVADAIFVYATNYQLGFEFCKMPNWILHFAFCSSSHLKKNCCSTNNNVLCSISQSTNWIVYMHHGCVYGSKTATWQCNSGMWT